MTSPNIFFTNEKQLQIDLAMRNIAKCYRGEIPYSEHIKSQVDYVFDFGSAKEIEFLKTLAYLTGEIEKE